VVVKVTSYDLPLAKRVFISDKGSNAGIRSSYPHVSAFVWLKGLCSPFAAPAFYPADKQDNEHQQHQQGNTREDHPGFLCWLERRHINTQMFGRPDFSVS